MGGRRVAALFLLPVAVADHFPPPSSPPLRAAAVHQLHRRRASWCLGGATSCVGMTRRVYQLPGLQRPGVVPCRSPPSPPAFRRLTGSPSRRAATGGGCEGELHGGSVGVRRAEFVHGYGRLRQQRPVYPVLRRDLPVRGLREPGRSTRPARARARWQRVLCGAPRRRPVGAALVAAAVLLRGRYVQVCSQRGDVVLRGRRHVDGVLDWVCEWSSATTEAACLLPGMWTTPSMRGRSTAGSIPPGAAGACLSRRRTSLRRKPANHRLRAGSKARRATAAPRRAQARGSCATWRPPAASTRRRRSSRPPTPPT